MGKLTKSVERCYCERAIELYGTRVALVETMRKGTATDLAGLAIRKLDTFEERSVKAAIGKKTTRFNHYEVTIGARQPYVIVKSAQQIEDLSERLKLEIFHVALPTLAARSPRAGGKGSTAADDYLLALAPLSSKLSESRSLNQFLTSNVA